MRGDRPCYDAHTIISYLFTPHARGSTALQTLISIGHSVYPACAGIDPFLYHLRIPFFGLPRMRGDRPRLLSPTQS